MSLECQLQEFVVNIPNHHSIIKLAVCVYSRFVYTQS